MYFEYSESWHPPDGDLRSRGNSVHFCLNGQAYGKRYERKTSGRARCVDHRSGPVRHRRGPPSPAALPRPQLCHPGIARRDGRDLGPVPLSGHTLRQRHVYIRLCLSALDGRQGLRRRTVDPRLYRIHGARGRDRRAYPLWPPRRSGRLEQRDGTLDRDGGARGRACALRLPLPDAVFGLLPVRSRLHARFRGAGGFPGRDRPSPALARGARLCRQARGGHRLGRDGRHPGPGDGGHGGPRHHGPALADLHRIAAGPRCPLPM